MRTSRAFTPIIVLLLGSGVAACSSGGAGAVAGATGSPEAAPATATSASGNGASGAYGAGGDASAAPAGVASVGIGDTSLGKVLVDGAGLTLYIFTPDTGGKSVCNGGCAASWPPLAGDPAPTSGAGLESASFGSITRDDGSAQATFFGMPLYSFAGDKAAGDVNGQGLNGKWYVVAADGTPVK